jgi:phytoene synthase
MNPPLRGLTRRLDGVYAGRPQDYPEDRALAAAVAHFRIPRELLDALLEGFAWDAEHRRYPDIGEVYAYSARVAGTVGAMMAILMGVRSARLLARACDLGVAMQLTNIARDVGEDARAGRLYLPLDWMREEGLDPEAWLADPVFQPALGRVVRRLLEAAERLYAQADEGIAGLLPACRPGISAARFLYAEIGRQVRRCGYDSVSRRAVVPGLRKLMLLGPSLAAAMAPHPARATLELQETRFLVDAAARAQARCPTEPAGIRGRALWVLDLFERLERRDRSRRDSALQDARRMAAARG